ncbi:MAG: PD40 domain-containing protein [Acidobacteriaceae bacterium]|nr:PD40 domain-containing protein [Acidobacteriaceae bacterium]MBV9781661.1 PD40 domain-containing protein [Acidobacteriaceae bacterium]
MSIANLDKEAVLVRHALISFALLSISGICFAQQEKPLLLRKPTVSRTQIVFSYAGDLWIVGREGGDAKRLTSGIGTETDPIFSPDGSLVAFTGEYDGNRDVYVVPAAGGVPQRLTYHPGADEAVGWTRDGKSVLFCSGRNSYSFGFHRLFTIPLTGGLASEVPLPRAEEGSYSPDGSHMAYVPVMQWQKAWKRYRGGQTKRIWIVNLSDSRVEEEIPRDNSNDFNPMWVGDTVWFLSDRSGTVGLFAYNPKTKQVRNVVGGNSFDLKSAAAGPDAIVYEEFGSIHLVDLKSGQDRKIEIRIAGDLPEVRPHFQKIEAKKVGYAGISPTGARAVVAVRGEILTVPAEKGDIRNLTNTPAIAERDPAWSPDGKSIAYFSDESGEYALHVRDQSGMGEVRKIDLGKPPTFYYSPTWSPDSSKIAYSDKRLNVWYVDVAKKAPVHIDTDTYAGPFNQFSPAWSPDSKWIAYSKQLRNHLHAIFVYSVDQQKHSQVTDGMSDALFPCFDKNGKYLYLTASTDAALSIGWLDMSSLNRPVTRSVYAVVLKKGDASPMAPESDEEKGADKDKDKDKDKESADKNKAAEKDPEKKAEEKPVSVQIDFADIGQRIVSLPIPPRNYNRIVAGKAGELFVVEGPLVDPIDFDPAGPSLVLHKFDLKTRKVDKIIEDINFFDLSFNGEKMLYRRREQWFIAPASKAAAEAPKPGEGGPLKLDALEVYVKPREEWKHMYKQVWRDERDFLYDPGLHGLDRAAIEKKYEPFLDTIASRDDLNYLFEEMLGNITIGHMFVGGGDMPETKKIKGGLLGADYSIDHGRYRFAHIYGGQNWNPKLRAPLTQPGVEVSAGEYLLAVRGRELHGSDNIYSFFEETAGQSVSIRVGPNADRSGSREVTVVPLEDETDLRNLSWIEDNRRKVDQMTGGRVAYIYLPNTAGEGFTNFNRYFFAQVDKEAAIIDERFNGGGDIADYIIDYLRRPLLSFWTMREGEDITTPLEGIFGPKVMLTNEMAGSGGDAMPWLFRKAGIGPLVGKRTWGGLVGHYTNPQDLIDGGFTGTPDLAFYTPESKWEIENHGVDPDVDVEFDPAQWRQGHDAQLDKAVEVVMDLLKKNPPPVHKRPAYPNYQVAARSGAK